MTSPHVGTFLYVGCYTHESPVAIGVYDASDRDGGLVELGAFTGVRHASFLAAHPGGQVLYAVSETTSFDGSDGGGILSFRIDQNDGSLTVLDRVSSHGAAPCYVSVDGDGRYLHVANYLSGTIAVYALGLDGRIGDVVAVRRHEGSGPNPDRQEGPHAHCIVPGPYGASVYAADLGIDRVMHYHYSDSTRGGSHGGLDVRGEAVLEPGSGPRHIAFHPHLPVAFVICELSSTIVTLAIDTVSGALEVRGSCSTLPPDFDGRSTAAEVRIGRDGSRVYASNRGHDSIAVFAFTHPDQPLEPLGHVDVGGRTPRNFALHPSGRAVLVANQDSNTIVRFGLDPGTGMPGPSEIVAEQSRPVGLTFVEGGR